MNAFSVSVVIPLFNKERFIRQTLDSVVQQTLSPVEIIVVDDGSEDGGADSVAELTDERIRLVMQSNQGPGSARNTGIKLARGEWVAFLDADDRWAPIHLQTLSEIARAHPEASVLSTRFERMSAHVPIPELEMQGEKSDICGFDYLGNPAEAGHIWTSATAVRREALLDLGGFASFMPGEDVDLWLRLALKYPCARSDRRTSFYSQHTSGIMESGLRREASDGGQTSLYRTMADALADPVHRSRRQDIRAFRDYFLRLEMKQALFNGQPALARQYMKLCEQECVSVPLIYRYLSKIPPLLLKPVVRYAARMRNAVLD